MARVTVEDLRCAYLESPLGTDVVRPRLSWTLHFTQRGYPSWGYMLGQGATTVWELWTGDSADPGMNSGNNITLVGDVVIWLYEYLAGIRPDPGPPGFKHIIMSYHFTSE